MQNSSDLLAPLTAAGLTVRVVNGDHLAVIPATRLTDDLRRHIRLHKPELLAMLAANEPYHLHSHGVIQYRLLSGAGGVLIDPDGIESAIQTLRHQYGERLDWLTLIDTLKGMDQVAQVEATKLIKRLNAG